MLYPYLYFHLSLKKNKSEHLYSALHGIQITLKRSGMDHTAFNLQRTPCQPIQDSSVCRMFGCMHNEQPNVFICQKYPEIPVSRYFLWRYIIVIHFVTPRLTRRTSLSLTTPVCSHQGVLLIVICMCVVRIHQTVTTSQLLHALHCYSCK